MIDDSTMAKNSNNKEQGQRGVPGRSFWYSNAFSNPSTPSTKLPFVFFCPHWTSKENLSSDKRQRYMRFSQSLSSTFDILPFLWSSSTFPAICADWTVMSASTCIHCVWSTINPVSNSYQVSKKHFPEEIHKPYKQPHYWRDTKQSNFHRSCEFVSPSFLCPLSRWQGGKLLRRIGSLWIPYQTRGRLTGPGQVGKLLHIALQHQ